MLDQSFSARTLLELVQYADVLKYKLWPVDSGADVRRQVMQDMAAQLNSGRFEFPAFREKSRAGKTIYSAATAASLLALRKINHNLLRVYKVWQSDRNALIFQLKALLQDACAYSVLRLDIASFYESVPREHLLQKLNADALLSYRNRELLRRLFAAPQFARSSGLPRGLAVSATLSELHLRDMDRAMSALPEVYFYGRYVDDIIVLSCGSAEEVSRLAEEAAAQTGLKLNPQKCQPVQCSGRHDKSCTTVRGFDYLGYNLQMREKPEGRDDWRKVTVGMAVSKKSKVKTRIARAFVAYTRDRDFGLLEKRLRFLSSNYPLRLDGSLRGGIFYSYQHLDKMEDLDELTHFMRRITFARRGSIGVKLNALLTPIERRQLARLDFREGFEHRRYHDYNRDELVRIGECWLYERN